MAEGLDQFIEFVGPETNVNVGPVTASFSGSETDRVRVTVLALPVHAVAFTFGRWFAAVVVGATVVVVVTATAVVAGAAVAGDAVVLVCADGAAVVAVAAVVTGDVVEVLAVVFVVRVAVVAVVAGVVAAAAADTGIPLSVRERVASLLRTDTSLSPFAR